MVNLRYHVVTLVAVFLALAVGVFLGAGPLQNRINSVGEGTTLAAQNEDLQGDLTAAQAISEEQQRFIAGLGKEATADILNGRQVALVLLPGVPQEVTDSINGALVDAGAAVAGTVKLTSSWVSVGEREYRDTLSAPVAGHLQGEGESADAVLAQALVEVLTTTGAEQSLVQEILSDPQTPLVESGSFPDVVVDTIVLVGANAGDDTQSGGAVEVVDSTLITLATKIAEGADSVAVGPADADSDLVTILRRASAPIATVDQVGTQMAGINVALVLAGTDTGAYGQGVGADAPVAPRP